MENEIIPYHRPFPLLEFERLMITGKIDEVLQSGMLTNGKYCRKLEEKIARMYNADYCLTTSNCTQALMIMLQAFFTRNRTLALSAFNWWSDRYINEMRHQPIDWIDIDNNTWLPKWNNDIQTLYLNTFGNVSDYEGENHVVYDSSHCLGARIPDFGLGHCFSLAPTKLVTSCEGGLIISTEPFVKPFLTELRDKCCRMSEVHAIIGLETLKHLDKIKQWKENTYKYYKANIPGQFQEIEYDSSYNTIGFLNTHGLEIPEWITTKQYYEPIHRGLKNTEEVYSKMVCLPSYYGCNRHEIVNGILDLNDKKITRGE